MGVLWSLYQSPDTPLDNKISETNETNGHNKTGQKSRTSSCETEFGESKLTETCSRDVGCAPHDERLELAVGDKKASRLCHGTEYGDGKTLSTSNQEVRAIITAMSNLRDKGP